MLTDKTKGKVDELKKGEAKKAEENKQAEEINAQQQQRDAEISSIQWKANVAKEMIQKKSSLSVFSTTLENMLNKLGAMKTAAEYEFKQFKQNFDDMNAQIHQAYMTGV
ncbi:MAG: hypothetical protein IJS54_04980 [Desulfovibrio sp.]|nr:hypothetical protein [Desulfovibrio sp.]